MGAELVVACMSGSCSSFGTFPTDFCVLFFVFCACMVRVLVIKKTIAYVQYVVTTIYLI